MILDFKSLIKTYNLDINGVIHIGAHDGAEYPAYKAHGIKNMMFFEPVPHIFERLEKNVGPEAKLYNMALGNKVGSDKIFFLESVDNDSCSSLLEPHIFKQLYSIPFKRMIDIEINKLDNIEYDRSDYNFINIDVQGYELEVFKGAIESLPHIDYIMAEINNVHLYKDGVLVDELDGFLSGFGFKRITQNWVGRNGTWGDGFYIKNP